MKQFNLKSYLIAWLRRGSYRVPYRAEVKKAARTSRGIYQCAHCKKGFKNGDFAIDHINPVISVRDGFVDWNSFIDSLYCGPEGLQVLCHECHDKKTKEENKKRKVSRVRNKARSRKARS